MKKRVLFMVFVLAVSASITGFTPVKNDAKGWKKIFEEAVKSTGAENEENSHADENDGGSYLNGDDAIPYTYKGQPLILENAEGDTLYSANYFLIDLAPEAAKTYPKLSKRVLSLNEEAASSVRSSIESSAGDAYDMFENGWGASYDLSTTFIPVRSDSKVFSFIEGSYIYAGGAHGYQSYESHNIDPGTGEEIFFYDVFDSTDDLPEILFKEILKQNEDLVDWFGDLLADEEAWQESYEREAFVGAAQRSLNESPVSLAWAIDYDGVRFYFNDYSLGSYAAGARNCKVKFEDYPELFTGKYEEKGASDTEKNEKKEASDIEKNEEKGASYIEKIAVQEDALKPEIMYAYQYEAVSAYADFLSTYMDNPVMAEDSELGEDIAEDLSDVRVNVIYLDDDEIPELVIANGDRPENPVHLLSYDPELQEVCLEGSFSMYGKMYYEPMTGNFIPMYYMPYGNGEVYQYAKGEYELKESWEMDYSDETAKFYVNGMKTSRAELEKTSEVWLQHPFRSVFSEYKSITPEGEDDLKYVLRRAAGLGNLTASFDGVWMAEEGEFAYLETDRENFAVFDENGYVEYMGAILNGEEGSLHNSYLFDGYTYDGGFFGSGEWMQADDPAEDVIVFKEQTFVRYDTTGTGTPVRSPGSFLMSDIRYLGEHQGVGTDGSLKIDMANVQTGGYEVTVDFGNGTTGHGYANITTNGILYINYAETDEGDYFTGEIMYEESSMEFDLKITESPSAKMPKGTRFSFSY